MLKKKFLHFCFCCCVVFCIAGCGVFSSSTNKDECDNGLKKLSKIDKKVVWVCGSSRVKPDTPFYELTRKTSKAMAEKDLAIITGGGYGLMEAANKGAMEGKGISICASMEFWGKMEINQYHTHALFFKDYTARKMMMTKIADVVVVAPGGLGTIDELFNVCTLFQINAQKEVPVILLGKDFWEGCLTWLRNVVYKEKMISASDLDRFQIADSPEEVIRLLKKNNVL